MSRDELINAVTKIPLDDTDRRMKIDILLWTWLDGVMESIVSGWRVV